MPKLRLREGLLAAAFGIGLAVSGGAAWSAESVLRIARDQDSTTFDNIMSAQNADVWLFNNIHDMLVHANPEGTGIEPALAESWDVSDDGKVYTFHLREGLKYSDGTPLKASDARFSLLRARDTKESPWQAIYSNIADVTAPDNQTVVVTLKEPSAPFLATMAMFAAAILPEAKFNELGAEGFAEKPIGAGAFTFEEWKRGDRVVMAKNPNYWEPGKPKLDRVEWLYIPNDNTRILKLQAGEADCMIFVPFNRVDEINSNPNLQVLLDPSTREDHLLMNHAHPPLDNKQVRKALHMAIDRQAIVDAVTFGHGQVANSFVPASAMFHSDQNKDYAYDPDGAKKLLDEAGVKDLTLKLLISAGDTVHEQIAVLLQDQLKKVGINVEVEKQEVGQAWESTVAGDYDLAVNYWTNDIVDPDQKTSFAVYGRDDNKSYYTNYLNQEVADLVEKGRVELDQAKRQDIYYRIQDIVKDEAHWVDLYYSPYRNACWKHVKGFKQNPLGRFMLEDVTIEK